MPGRVAVFEAKMTAADWVALLMMTVGYDRNVMSYCIKIEAAA